MGGVSKSVTSIGIFENFSEKENASALQRGKNVRRVCENDFFQCAIRAIKSRGVEKSLTNITRSEKEILIMTMAEKKLISVQKEVEKLGSSLERYKSILEKKQGICAKLGCDWTDEEMREHRDSDMSDKQWDAWFKMSIAKYDVDDASSRLENALNRLNKAEIEWAKVEGEIEKQEEITAKEIAWLEHLEESEEAYYKWLEQFKAECLQDGIVIEGQADRYGMHGKTRSGLDFGIWINNGFSKRSLHSYTLYIVENGERKVIFTSGLFSTAYRYLMK